jgi:hypothetical protein
MYLDAPCMALVDHESEGIPARVWCLSLPSREVTTPGLELARIPSISLGTYLEDQDVAPRLPQELDPSGQEPPSLLTS